MKKQNHLLLYATLAIAIVIVMICIFQGNDDSKPSPIREISFETMIQKFEAKETFILYIGANNCTHCLELKPILTGALNETGKIAYYIDTAKLTDEEDNKLKEHVEYRGTPNVAFIKNGQENQMRRMIGSGYSKEKVIEFINKGFN